MTKSRTAPAAQSAEYKDVVAFIRVGKEQKIKPITIGYAKFNAKGDLAVYLQSTPVGSWDGSLVIQDRRVKDEDPDGF